MNAPAPLPTVRVVRDPLVTLTCVFVMLAVAGYAFETVRQHLASAAATVTRGPQAGKLEQSAHTNALAAHFTFTNLNTFDAETCVRGIVTPKKGASRVVSAPVCTGVMKPRTTIVLEASYPAGAVEDMCSGEANSFGMKHIEWSRCSFEVEPVTGPSPGAG